MFSLVPRPNQPGGADSRRGTASAWTTPVLGSLALAVAYFVTARLCVLLADTGKSPAAMWVPSGLALAVLLQFGPRLWPGVFLGSLAANLVVGVSVPWAVLLALGNALDGLIGVWGIRRHAGPRLDFGRTRHVLAFIAYGVLIGPALAATLGMLSLGLDGLSTSLVDEVTGWVGWALEDGLAVLVIGSALLLGAQAWRANWRSRGKRIEASGLLGLLAVNAWLVLTSARGQPFSEPYLVLPLMLWVVLRLGAPGAIAGNLLVTSLAAWAIVNRQGPFMLDSLAASMVWMQAFSAVASLTTLLLAAALNEARAERYRQMFDGNQTMQLVVDGKTGRIVDANAAACAFYGRSSDGMRALTLGDLSAVALQNPVAVLTKTLREGRAVFVRRHRTASGEVRDVELLGNAIQIDGRPLVYAIVHDLTARRRAEEALRQSEERLQLVARATNDTVWDWDMRTDSLWHNHGRGSVFGHAGEAEGTGLAWVASHVHPDDRARMLNTIAAAAERGDETWNQEYRFRRDDGSYAHVLARGYILYENAIPVRMVGVLLDLSERKRMEEELAHRATHDTLTGLANRALIESALQETIATARQQGATLGLLIADLDHFKEINDTLGHGTGDRVLQVVAERWRAVLRQGDTLGRLAGDEFAVLLPRADAATADAIAQRLVRALDEPISVDGHQLRVGASVGRATFPGEAADLERLVRRADQAMYVAKRRGGGVGASDTTNLEPEAA